MMNQEQKRMARLIAFYSVLILLLAWLMPAELNWSPSFSKDRAWPYGSKILFDQLDQLFPGYEIRNSDRPLYNTLVDSTHDSYISISDQLTSDKLDVESFLKHVSRGNTAFLSSETFEANLLDTLNLKLSYEFKTHDIKSLPTSDANLILNLTNPGLENNKEYSMRAVRFYRHFEPLYDSIRLTALGYIEKDKVCFTKVRFGKGEIYLHSFPYAFTNYHMLQDDNYEYVANCLSYIPLSSIIWDEYYKFDRRNRKESPLKTILQSRSFRWAYWLGIVSLLLFMIFQIKRKQAIIPVLKPFKNDSLLFTKTIGDLYFEKGNNHGLALKKIAVFKEYLHRNFFFENIRFEESEILPLCEKSGKDINFVRELWAEIKRKRESKLLNDQELLRFSQLLNQFYGRINQ